MTGFERDHVRLLLLTLAPGPVAGVVAWWVTVLAFQLDSDPSALWTLGVVLTAVGAGALVTFARRRGIAGFWATASVVALVVATAAWGFVSFWVWALYLYACLAGCG